MIAGAIALIGWLPYLLAAIGGSPADTGTAQHYLPSDGAQLSFPMLQFTLLGALCMLGTLWLVVRARSSTRAGALAIGVLAVYAWSLLSMLTTLAGTTLLSFRLQPTLTVLLTAAGAFGFIETTLAIARRYSPETGAPHRRRGRGARRDRRDDVQPRTSPTCCGPTSSSPTPTPTATASGPIAARPARSGTTARSTPRSRR